VTGLRITAVETVDLGNTAPDEAVDVVFVVVRTAHASGCYGPVTRPVGVRVQDLAPGVVGAAIEAAGDPRPLPPPRMSVDVLTSWALGAIDCARWDLRGQLAGRPVADLLSSYVSGATSVNAYASLLTCQLTEPGAAATVAQAALGGWAFTKWGLRSEPGRDHRQQVRDLAEAVGSAAAAVGGPVAVDALRTWSAELAAAFARSVDLGALIWLEDPLPPGDPGYRALACSGVPVAVGEHLLLGDDLSALLAAGRPAGLCLDVVGCGGLTRAVALTEQARRLRIPIYPHGRSLIPAVHLAAAFPETVPAVEFRLRWEPARQDLLAAPLIPDNGRLAVPTAAGLGAAPRRMPCPTR
jgi:L-alanine-DL-glutamate epimerase-like enolase superfamily enzyme